MMVRQVKSGYQGSGESRWPFSPSTLFNAFLMAFCLLTSAEARAEFYMTAAISKAQLRHNGQNGWWIQEGWAYTIDSGSNGYSVGLGYKVNKYLSVETAYHDLGAYHEFAGFMIQEEHYSAVAPDHCVNGCAPTSWGYLDGSATAFSISALPRLPITKDFSLYGRYGLEFHRAKFSFRAAPSDTNTRGFALPMSFTQEGHGLLYGLGITYKAVSVELQQFKNVFVDLGPIAGGSPYREARAFNVSYRWDF